MASGKVRNGFIRNSVTYTAASAYKLSGGGVTADDHQIFIDGYLQKYAGGVISQITTDTTMLTLPEGARPSVMRQFICPVGSNGSKIDGWAAMALYNTGELKCRYMSESGYIWLGRSIPR
jgi:hypothetical protein